MSNIVELRQGSALLRLAPLLGGRVTRCALENGSGESVDIFAPYPEEHTDLDHWAKGGLYPLIPYGGRIAHSRLHEEAHVHALEPHPDAWPHTLHGSAHRSAWSVEAQTASMATLRLAQKADAHWPWHYQADMVFRLQPRQLHIAVSLTNTDSRPMPAGIGLHPYLCRSPQGRMQFVAKDHWPLTQDYLAGTSAPLQAPDDFGQWRLLGAAAPTVFYSGWEGTACMVDTAGDALTLQASPSLSHLVLHQPDAAPYFCLEPLSHVADAFNLAWRGVQCTGARVLAPGDSLEGWVCFLSTSISTEQAVDDSISPEPC